MIRCDLFTYLYLLRLLLSHNFDLIVVLGDFGFGHSLQLSVVSLRRDDSGMLPNPNHSTYRTYFTVKSFLNFHLKETAIIILYRQTLEQMKLDEYEKQRMREEKRKEKHLKKLREQEQNQLNSKIRSEERKLMIAQRKLESIRVLEALFERIKVIIIH